MCYPKNQGPRCSAHGRIRLDAANQKFNTIVKEDPTNITAVFAAKKAVEVAQMEFDTTPKGIATLRANGDTSKAKQMEEYRNARIAEFKNKNPDVALPAEDSPAAPVITKQTQEDKDARTDLLAFVKVKAEPTPRITKTEVEPLNIKGIRSSKELLEIASSPTTPLSHLEQLIADKTSYGSASRSTIAERTDLTSKMYSDLANNDGSTSVRTAIAFNASPEAEDAKWSLIGNADDHSYAVIAALASSEHTTAEQSDMLANNLAVTWEDTLTTGQSEKLGYLITDSSPRARVIGEKAVRIRAFNQGLIEDMDVNDGDAPFPASWLLKALTKQEEF